MAGGDGGVAEQAEPHGAIPLGMVARRAHRGEGGAAQPSITASTAATAPPAARNAAAWLPALITVSGSTGPGARASNAST